MKKLLFALALTSFVTGAAFATDGDKTDKNAKKAAVAKKECSAEAKAHCSKDMAGGKSCCASKNKTASLITPKPVAASAASTAEAAK